MLNQLAQDQNIQTSTITRNLVSNLKHMNSQDILFLNVAENGICTSQEVQEIIKFVERGGKLFVIGEHYGDGYSQFQKPVLENFGMNFVESWVEDSSNHLLDREEWITFNSSYFNLNNLSFMFGTWINLTQNAPFSMANSSFSANEPNKPLLAGFDHSNTLGGKVFCAGDSEWLCNGNSSIGGMKYGNNSRLALEVLNWFYEENFTFQRE